MAGSKIRTNIQGHTVIAEVDDVRFLRRQSSVLLGRILREAQEQGQTHVTIDGRAISIQSHSDHTLTLEPGSNRNHTTL